MGVTRRMRILCWIGAGLFAALGAALLIGGVRLVAIGGSWYYLIAGLALLATGVLIARGNRWAIFVHAGLTLATIAWGLAEVGFDPWALMPRVSVLAILGFVALLLLSARIVEPPPGADPYPNNRTDAPDAESSRDGRD